MDKYNFLFSLILYQKHLPQSTPKSCWLQKQTCQQDPNEGRGLAKQGNQSLTETTVKTSALQIWIQIRYFHLIKSKAVKIFYLRKWDLKVKHHKKVSFAAFP